MFIIINNVPSTAVYPKITNIYEHNAAFPAAARAMTETPLEATFLLCHPQPCIRSNFKYEEIDSIAIGEAKIREAIEKGEVKIVYSNH